MLRVRNASASFALAVVLTSPGLGYASPAVAPGPVADGSAPATVPPAADVPDPNDPVDRLAIMTGIARKKGRRLMRELRIRESDLPTAIAAVRRTERDGTEDLFVAYEVSLFNRCVYAGAPEGRDALRAAREGCAGERGIETKLAHVRIAPTPRGRTEDTGGALEFAGEPIALGSRGASYDRMPSQTFFDGMGPVDPSPTSDLRIWVSVTEVEFEESSDARGEFERNSWYGQGAQTLVLYDRTLGADCEAELATGEFTASAGTPAVTFDASAHVLDVRVGERHVRLRYVAASDSFEPAS